MTPFEKAVKNYLDNRAKEDEQFALNYAKTNKYFGECIRFIYDEVRKLNTKHGNCVGMRDEDVFGLAVHYYDEDDIEVSEKVNDIVADYIKEEASKVELTDEEKSQARQLALQNEAERLRRKMQDDEDRRKKQQRERIKMQQEREEAQSDCLFTFED